MDKKETTYYRKLIFLIFAFILILCLSLSADVNSLEAKAATDSGTWGDNITWEYANGTLTIRGSGPMQDCPIRTEGNTHHFLALVYPYSDRDKITKVVIEEGVTSIGNWNFYKWYPNITTVILPDTLTNIGVGAFGSDTHDPTNPVYNKLRTIKMSNSLKNIGNHAFGDCIHLENIVFPNTLTKIGDFAFFHCDRLTSINIPGSVKTIGDTSFAECKNLSEIQISEGVSQIRESAFSACKKLTSISIPSSVSDIGPMAFAECTNLRKVTISNGVSEIKRMAFDGCKKLKNIDIPASVSKIDYWTFNDCKNLTSVKIRNPHCKIITRSSLACQNWETIPSKTTIYGYKGSTAQKYAKKFGCKFKSLSKSSNKGSSSSVSSKKGKVKNIAFTRKTKHIRAGKSFTFRAKVTPSTTAQKGIIWKSSNKKYATVNSKGKVTAKKAGKGKTVKITAKSKADSRKKISIKIKIQ